MWLGGTSSHRPPQGLPAVPPYAKQTTDGGQAGAPHPSQGNSETTSHNTDKGLTGVSMEARWEWGPG